MSKLEREQLIFARLTIKAKKAYQAAQAALSHWLSYNPPKAMSQSKDQELYEDYTRKNEISKRVLIQLEECEERIAEMKEE